MKAWKVWGHAGNIGWCVFRARNRSAARYQYIRTCLGNMFVNDFPALSAIRYPYCDTDDDRVGEVRLSECDPADIAEVKW